MSLNIEAQIDEICYDVATGDLSTCPAPIRGYIEALNALLDRAYDDGDCLSFYRIIEAQNKIIEDQFRPLYAIH
jgi:hypothetical protein